MRVRDFFAEIELEEAQGDLDRSVTGLSYDSRRVRKGDLFFAIPGTRFDGHAFAGEALRRGASAVVLERRVELPEAATWIRVGSARRAMGKCAALYFGHPSRRLVVVGVTGTNGKTTVTYLLESIFSSSGMAPGVIGTVSYRYPGRACPASQTTPESVELQSFLAEMADAGVRSVAIEVSSHALAQERARGVDFDGAVFTNLSRDHLDFHLDMEHYFSTKSKLFTDLLRASFKPRRFAAINCGDPRGRALLAEVRASGLEAVSYGLGSGWDVYPLEIRSDLAGLRGKISVKGRALEFSSRLIGAANLENILAAVAAGYALGLPFPSIAEGIARLGLIPGRLERIENALGLTILVDYAHSPDALEKVLSTLRDLVFSKPEARSSKLICVFGCGGERDRGKRPVMGEIGARLSDLVVLTSDNPRSEDPLRIIEEIEQGMAGMRKLRISDFESGLSNPKSEIQNLKSTKGYFVEPDRQAAIRLALRLARPGDLVLLAGKGHEDYQIVGSDWIRFDDREAAREELHKLGSMVRGGAESG